MSVTSSQMALPFWELIYRKCEQAPKLSKVKFAMQYGNGMTLETAKHKLAGVFNTSEAVKIVISDEPDKYYMGLVIWLCRYGKYY